MNLFPLEFIQSILFLEYKEASPQPQTSSSFFLLSNVAIEGYLPKDKEEESNILKASEEHMARRLSKMKEGLNIDITEEAIEIAQNLEVYPVPRMATPRRTFPMAHTVLEDNEEDNVPLSWKIKKRIVPTSNKGKEKEICETIPKGRHVTLEGSKIN